MEPIVPNMFVDGATVGGKFNNKTFIEKGREHGKLIAQESVKRL